MALPKEPRQKMINMMYLVLTALLALNVSSEILNAFKTVNDSIIKANTVIDDKNKTTYESLADKLKDDKTREKAAIWAPKAEAARSLSADVYNYLENLKKQLKEEAGLKKEDGAEQFKEDDLDAATRLMTNKGEGSKLLAKLTEYKEKMLNIVPEMHDQFDKTLPLNLTVPETRADGVAKKDWTTAYFHMTPAIAAVTILSKFQNDVKNSEAQLADYCHNQVGQVKFTLNAFQAFAGTNSTYLMPGQELVITSGIGAFSTEAKPSITVNGSTVALGPDGTAVYKTTVNGAGEHKVNVVVNYKDPNTGEDKTVSKEVSYTVGVPSGSSMFLEKMNVMYVGVENPLTISAGSAGREKMNVSFTGGSLTSAGGDRYVAKPAQVGPAEIKITVDGKTNAFPIRCKTLPDPTAMVGTKRGGTVSAAEFKVQGGILARLMDSEFDAAFQVVGYTVGANGGAFQNYQQARNDGSRWSGNAASIIAHATPGTSIFFDQIQVKGPDGKVRELPTLAFQLK